MKHDIVQFATLSSARGYFQLMNWSAGHTIPSWNRMGVFPAVWGPAGTFYWPGRGALRGPSGWLARGCFQQVARAGLHYARAFLLGGLRRQLEPPHMTWAPSACREHSDHYEKRQHSINHQHDMGTLWLFNIAMENGPFIDGLPINKQLWFSMAMLVYQRVYIIASLTLR